MKFFNIKKGNKVEMVQCESINKIDRYCKEKGYRDWQMVGMMSTSELLEKQKSCRIV